MDSDSCNSNSNSTSSDYFLHQETRTGIKRYFCCFFIKHNKGNYLKQHDKQEEKNKLVQKEQLEEEEDDDDLNDYLPTWSINQVHKDSFYRRSSNSSGLKTVRFDSSSF
jgi:hypothetical protein